MAVDVKRIIQELVVPELQGIKSELATIKVEIKRLDEKIDGAKEDIRHLRDEMHHMREEFRLAIDIHERLASLEAKIGH